MGVNFQIAVDCADPHTLARFWSDALGWPVEEHEAQIKQLQADGLVTDDDVTTFDGKLVFKTAAAIRDPEAAKSAKGTPQRGRMLFQHVPEAKTTKNRVHLDIYFDSDDRDAEVERLVGLGAHRLWDGRQGPHTWVTMSDPEGNEFCVA